MVNNLPANAGDVRDMGAIPGLGIFLGGGHGNPLQYSCHGPRSLVANSMDSMVHRVFAKSWVRLKRLSTHAWLEKNDENIKR